VTILPRSQANLLLLIAAIIWGSTFVVQKLVFIGDSQLGLFTFTALRFGLGALVVVPFALHESAKASEPLKGQTFVIFACIGAVLFGALITQQSGINRTSVTNAGFLTGLYVVIVPGLALVLFRKRTHWSVWPASGGCMGGLYLLNGGSLSEISTGDLWIIFSSFFWALHVVLVGVFAASSGRPLTLACIQFSAGALLGLVCTITFENPTLVVIMGFWPEILYAGAVAVGIAFTLQVVGQRYTQPADAAIILVLEMPFAALAAALVLGERLSPMGLTGCSVILVSVLGAEVLPLLKNTTQAQRHKSTGERNNL
jgi:drug/metabolite transporter (DMT)-like permease